VKTDDAMTEAEWLSSADPAGVLGELAGRVSARQLRLAYCACLRSDPIARLLVSKGSRRAGEVSEQYADGRTSAAALRSARVGAHSAWARIGPLKPEQYAAAELAHNACWLDPTMLRAGLTALQRLAGSSGLVIPVALLHDIFGNPFRPVSLDPAWRTSAVVDLARGIYEERAFDRMPILGDALDDAGCDVEAVLAHCRCENATHVRGCWVVDLVLGKA
jgi:hypothetical protein